MKKILFLLMFFGCLGFFALGSVSAEEINSDSLDKDSQEVLESYDNPTDIIEEGNDYVGNTVTSTSTKRWTFKRGSWLAWSKGIVSWSYNGKKITKSDAWQDSGYVFPNLVSELGIKKIGTSTSSRHVYRHKTSIAIGTPTPWGDVKLAKTGYTVMYPFVKTRKSFF